MVVDEEGADFEGGGLVGFGVGGGVGLGVGDAAYGAQGDGVDLWAAAAKSGRGAQQKTRGYGEQEHRRLWSSERWLLEKNPECWHADRTMLPCTIAAEGVCWHFWGVEKRG